MKTTKIDDNKWYTVIEAARVSGVSEDTIYKRAINNPGKWGFKLKRKEELIWQITGREIKKWEKVKEEDKRGRPLVKRPLQ